MEMWIHYTVHAMSWKLMQHDATEISADSAESMDMITFLFQVKASFCCDGTAPHCISGQKCIAMLLG